MIYGSIPFNTRTKPGSMGGLFREEIKPGAFAKSLKERPVMAFAHHDPAMILGRTENRTLKIWEDGVKALRFELNPVDTSYARDLLAAIRSNTVVGVSFGFTAVRDKWINILGERIRELHEAELFEVSIVTSGAYGGTTLSLRHNRPVYRATIAANNLKFKLIDLWERT